MANESPTRADLLLTPRDLPAKLRYTPKRLRDLLKDLGITRQHAAELLGTSKSNIDNYTVDASSSTHRDMKAAEWNLLLMLVDQHPYWRLEPTVKGSKP